MTLKKEEFLPCPNICLQRTPTQIKNKERTEMTKEIT